MWYCLLLALLGTTFAQNSGPKHGQDSTVCSVSPTPAPGSKLLVSERKLIRVAGGTVVFPVP